MKVKGILLIILIVVGVVMAIRRFFKNSLQGGKLEKLVNRINTDPNFVNDLTDSLFERFDVTKLNEAFSFPQFVSGLTATAAIDNFAIELVYKKGKDKVLVVTTCTDQTHDLQVSGGFGDVKNISIINFILFFDEAKNQLVCQSDFTKDGHQRGLRMAFARKVFGRVDWGIRRERWLVGNDA